MLESLETSMFYILVMACTLCMVLYWVWLGTKKEFVGRLATSLTIIGVIASTVAIILRMITSGHPPLSNGYEFLLTFCLGIMAVYLYAEFRYKLRSLGAFVMPIPFLLLMFIIMSMGPEERIAQAVPPALKSQWLTFHVITAMFAYGAFAVSFGLGIMYLLKLSKEDTGKKRQPAGDCLAFPCVRSTR
ncbi:Cytochrome c-type biogenesis protein CcsA/ResC [Desulfosporosinus sp. BG]|nr:cytochrome c biogenesis protein CcsA [Desulfosporosinus sp. BG]ODA41987.1 Cytochrome c-type biogenesis protein CcsA/ResC [Desulfosporosinus sp. BG]